MSAMANARCARNTPHFFVISMVMIMLMMTMVMMVMMMISMLVYVDDDDGYVCGWAHSAHFLVVSHLFPSQWTRPASDCSAQNNNPVMVDMIHYKFPHLNVFQ